jgi:hypothetical protein
MDVKASITRKLGLPERERLPLELADLTAKSDGARRCFEAVTQGSFIHPDGRQEPLLDIRLSPEQLGLLAYLARRCPTKLSLDIGFGMGSSSTMIMAARASINHDFEHVVFDPYGLPGGRGLLVNEYLETEFARVYRRVWKRSEIGLAQLFDEVGPNSVGLTFIDGYHTFDQVLVDFFMADLLCIRGGYILFDDAHFPAIEAAIEYIRTNRPDYVVGSLPIFNTSVVRKINSNKPSWDTFVPFSVPQRHGWTPHPTASTAWA